MSHVTALAAALPAIKNPAIDYHAIAPELVLAGTVFAVLVLDLFLPPQRKWMAMALSLAGVAGSLAATLTLISVLSTAITLYGLRRIYGVTHPIDLAGIAASLKTSVGSSNIALAAILFVVAGFAFKVSAFPFQFWAPDTYEGSPVPVAAFLSVASKAAGFAGLLQILFVAFLPRADFWAPILAVLSLFTMTIGNLVALQQRQVVRLLAYSSIAQAGYMLLPFALATRGGFSVNHEAFAATVLYFLIY